jgi:hypothetical protein
VSERDGGELRRQLQHLEGLLREMEDGPESPARARARGIVQAVLELHAEALRRMTGMVATAASSGPALLDAFAGDPAIAGVLLLHGLHPLDLESRVRGALEALTPALQGHGVRVAAVAISDVAVRIRLERDPGRGGLPAGALRARLEDAIVAVAPDASTIDVEVPAEPPTFVPLEHVRLRPRPPEPPPR